MTQSKRIPTDYTGVFFREVKRLGGNGTERMYYVTIKENGKKIECKVGRQYRDAITPAKANLFRSEILSGKRPIPQEKRRQDAARPSITRLWEVYKDTLTNKHTLASDTTNYGHLDQFHGKVPEEIETLEIDRFQKKMEKAGYSGQTIHHVVGLLRRIIRFGAKKNLCDLPGRLVFNMPVLDNEKTENLTEEQLQRLLRALATDRDQMLANMMRLALATGMRRGALFGLKWTDIDHARGFILLRGENAKSGKTEIIPMNDAARAIIESHHRIDGSEYLFPGAHGGKRTDAKHFLARIRQTAGLPDDFRPLHGLRHVYASRLASSGVVDMYTLQRLLTHSSPQMTQRYSHLADEALMRAASVANGLFTDFGDSP